MIQEIEGVFYNDPPIPETTAETISVLSKSDSMYQWHKYVTDSCGC